MSSIIVVGHKNPDNDAISAAVGYAYLKNELARRAGEEAVFEPVRLGPLPPETEWIMGERGIEQPRLIESVPEGAKVILVDHNEMLQSVDGLNTDDLVEVVDHHRLGGLTTAQPIRVNVKPVGSTAAIVAREFEIEGVELPESIAALLLGAMLTDTVIIEVAHHDRLRPRYDCAHCQDPGRRSGRIRNGHLQVPFEPRRSSLSTSW